jgi:hypothetical protein
VTRQDDDRCSVPGAPEDDVPVCGTGPTGRARFVARELADLWSELRGRRSTDRTTTTTKEDDDA